MSTFIRGAFVPLVALLVSSSAVGEDPPPTVAQVRDLLRGDESQTSGHKQLVALGARALPAYEAILADPKSEPLELAGAMTYVSDIKADRKQFPDLAVALFTHEDPVVRREALRLLAEIGSERDTTPILAMLSDEENGVRHAAAKTLAKIGGKRDLVALDIWLKTGNYQGDPFHFQHVKECRNALEKRLKEAQKDKK
jgi:HEAT repeat protein